MNKVALTIVACVLIFPIVLGSVVYFFSSALGEVRADFADYRSEAEAELEERASAIDNLTKTNDNLTKALNDTLLELEDVRAQLNETNNLNAILMGAINGEDAGKLQTVIWHVSYKGADSAFGNTDNFTDTYNAVKNGTVQDVLVVPELPRDLNWSAQLTWYAANFTNVKVCLQAFEGGDDPTTPLANLTIAQISQVTEVCDAPMIRFQEPISWYSNQSLRMPVEYFRDVLSYCRANGKTVVWAEWLNTNETWQQLADTIKGYEDIVTVLYETNNGSDEPVVGYMAVSSRFMHWGASVQSWYWWTHYNIDQDKMPISLLTSHALLAKNMGAEVLQFEPSWYFFDNSGLLNDRGRAFKVIVS